ncbi:HdeD family acid-resistance protein [Pseudoxanthomonas sp. 10H]|uniref:HdeD family acid-resistance protein n=1 Tax=Pseudoxanthomonas sp. 10H TaxID=3242729 RepID=UPI0035576698
MSRAWWVFLLYGLFAIIFGLFALFRPHSTVWMMVMAFGVLALADGVVSLLSVFRKDVALPNWLLVVYAAASIGFGLLALLQTQMVATALVWLLAIWLVVAGIARIVFAVQLRQLVRGNWLLALSGVLALLLGLLFIARPNIGVATLAAWLGIGALVYGVLQVALAFYMRRRTTRVL